MNSPFYLIVSWSIVPPGCNIWLVAHGNTERNDRERLKTYMSVLTGPGFTALTVASNSRPRARFPSQCLALISLSLDIDLKMINVITELER